MEGQLRRVGPSEAVVVSLCHCRELTAKRRVPKGRAFSIRCFSYFVPKRILLLSFWAEFQNRNTSRSPFDNMNFTSDMQAAKPELNFNLKQLHVIFPFLIKIVLMHLTDWRKIDTILVSHAQLTRWVVALQKATMSLENQRKEDNYTFHVSLRWLQKKNFQMKADLSAVRRPMEVIILFFCFCSVSCKNCESDFSLCCVFGPFCWDVIWTTVLKSWHAPQ